MNDLLNREDFINELVKIVNKKTQDGGSCAFAIDGAWGSGKSWALDKLERNLQGIGDDEDVDVKNAKGNYFTFHYNAWENDYYDEPLIAILSTIIERLNELYKVEHFAKGIGKSIVEGLKSIANNIVETVTGINVSKAISKAKENGKINSDFNQYYNVGLAIKEVRKHLTDLANTQVPVSENENTVFPIIFIVDELDRCLPEYAIKVLERLHHVFNDLPHSILILSLDQTQLNHTIQKIFGDKVNKEAYLAKFIDFSVKLDEGVLNEEMFWQEFADYKEMFCKLYIQSEYDYEKIWTENLFHGIPMRDRLQIIKKAKFIHTLLFKSKSKYQISVMYGELLLIISRWIYKKDKEEYKKYLQAKYSISESHRYPQEINCELFHFAANTFAKIALSYKKIDEYSSFAFEEKDYFNYTLYRYNIEKNKTSIYLEDRKIFDRIDVEKRFLKEYETYLTFID